MFHLTCKHKWKVLESVKCTSEFGDSWLLVLLACENCGKLRKVKM